MSANNKNTCERCVYWLTQTLQISGNEKSLCYLSKQRNQNLFASGGLYTTKDFACNEYQARLPNKLTNKNENV